MAGPTTFATADRIIRFGMKDAGLLQEGDEPNGEDYAQALQRLNDILNLTQTQGIKLWLNFMQSITLTAGVSSYVLGPAGAILSVKPPRVLEAYYLTPQNISRPLINLSRNEYNLLPNLTQQGAIASYFVDRQQLNTVVNFWLVPDASAATGTCSLLVQRQVANVVSLTDDMNFPIEWFMYLRWALADDISTGQPQSIVQRCSQRAEAYRTALEDWDVEDADTLFQPDAQIGMLRRIR
jgi:hypothetical protein